MPSFPTSVFAPTNKSAGQTIQPAHVNDAQDEIVAIEGGYLNGTARLNSSASTVASLGVTGASTIGGRLVVSSGLSVAGNSTLASSITLGAIPYVFPSSGGSVGQALAIVSTSGSTIGLEWRAGAFPPRIIASTVFEDTARFTETLVGGAGVSYGTAGVDLDTSATISSSAHCLWTAMNAGNGGGVFTVFPTEWNAIIRPSAIGTDFQSFFGLGAPTVGGAGITYTVNHIGFKITRAASGAINLVATQAGGTETASATLTTVATNDSIDLALRVNGTSSVDYWWRKNDGAWSSATNLTTNVPTANVSGISAMISNAGVATQSEFNVYAMALVR